MADTPDRLLEQTGARLTPRAKVLLHMILDGLADEPIRWKRELAPQEESDLRAHQVRRVHEAVPGLLHALAEKSGKRHGEEPITLYDMLHHFESIAGFLFFPGKLP